MFQFHNFLGIDLCFLLLSNQSGTFLLGTGHPTNANPGHLLVRSSLWWLEGCASSYNCGHNSFWNPKCKGNFPS